MVEAFTSDLIAQVQNVFSSGSGLQIPNYVRIDLSVVIIANLINIVMTFLFATRISGLPQMQYGLGIVVLFLDFTLGYFAFLNKKKGRGKWLTFLLMPIFIFSVVDMFLDYVLVLDFRSTVWVAPFVLLYYIGLWGLIGYSFMFGKKWGFLTLATYFANMVMSILPYTVPW